jgi:hypothetical protein
MHGGWFNQSHHEPRISEVRRGQCAVCLPQRSEEGDGPVAAASLPAQLIRSLGLPVEQHRDG